MMGDIDFYYFSGTGNTMLAAHRMAEVFRENGCNVNLHRIEYSDASNINKDNVIGLGFPVAIFSTYNLVWNFIKSLPEVNGTEIFMMDTLGGGSGGIVGPLRHLLEKKGYKPIGSCEIPMPINIFYIQDEETNRKKIAKGLKKAEKYAKSIIQGKSKWKRVPVFSDAMNIVSITGLMLTATNVHQKYLKLKSSRELCNQCGICSDICPVSNIVMDDYPVTGNKCEYCMRCVSTCPRGAIKSIFTYKGKTHSAVKAKDFIKNDI